jgi:hypothetical protein
LIVLPNEDKSAFKADLESQKTTGEQEGSAFDLWLKQAGTDCEEVSI